MNVNKSGKRPQNIYKQKIEKTKIQMSKKNSTKTHIKSVESLQCVDGSGGDGGGNGAAQQQSAEVEIVAAAAAAEKVSHIKMPITESAN